MCVIVNIYVCMYVNVFVYILYIYLTYYDRVVVIFEIINTMDD